ncbi:hypothetical protein DPMN_037079 [Dreissena polymorpha]|uniref:Uncharacterized protein n=1 Tax=Dreissena polymorpha TaxID=45954 RepID=A0A9D4RMH0_DREPO|nr:hypothetical protein DPMN_037079 [Dreissena polymorpha]
MFVAPQTTSWASLWLMFVAFTFPIFSTTSPGAGLLEFAATLPDVTVLSGKKEEASGFKPLLLRC